MQKKHFCPSFKKIERFLFELKQKFSDNYFQPGQEFLKKWISIFEIAAARTFERWMFRFVHRRNLCQQIGPLAIRYPLDLYIASYWMEVIHWIYTLDFLIGSIHWILLIVCQFDLIRVIPFTDKIRICVHLRIWSNICLMFLCVPRVCGHFTMVQIKAYVLKKLLNVETHCPLLKLKRLN